MAEDEPDEVSKLPPDARLESLDERIDKLQQAEAKRTAKRRPDPSYQSGQLVLSQLVGCPLGGGIVGWLLDRWFGSRFSARTNLPTAKPPCLCLHLSLVRLDCIAPNHQQKAP